MSEISVNSVSNISSSNYVSNKSSLSMEQKQEEVNISNPETIVEISSAGKELLSYDKLKYAYHALETSL